MNTLTARTSDGTYGVTIDADSMKEIDRLCSAAGDVETGGILIGQYTTDRSTALVLEATPPPTDSERGRSWFVRGVAGLRELLRRRWHSKTPRYYVGEWHFHPAAAVEPSSDDLDQMVRIADTREYSCKEPVLLILGRPAGERGTRPVRVFVFPVGEPPMELYPETDALPSGQANPGPRP